MDSKICIIGAGAIGGVPAALMAKAGLSVTLVTKHPEIAEISNTQGLSISGVCGNERVRVPAVDDEPVARMTLSLAREGIGIVRLEECNEGLEGIFLALTGSEASL